MTRAQSRDLYQVLGVRRDADDAELKRAYHELAMRYHPDKNPGSPAAEERFKEVSQAYAVLSDAGARARYDRFGDAAAGLEAAVGSVAEMLGTLWGDLVGRKRAAGVSGRDLRYTLEIDFVEAALGCQKTISVHALAACDACQGSGARGGTAGLAACTSCGGQGEIKLQQGFIRLARRCSTCAGFGKVVTDPCEACRGGGRVEKEREFVVTIPPGTEEGGVRRVAGQGEPGHRGGAPGDLHVVVRVRPHPLLHREGRVVVCEVPLSFAEASLGEAITVPTLEGVAEMLVPIGTQTGTVFRLKGKGIPWAGAPRGDLHVRVIVETPTDTGSRARELLAALAEISDDTTLPRRAAYRHAVSELEVKREKAPV